METFNFPFHKVQTEYPESSVQIRFGRGYQFATEPRGPDQLTFRLTFPTMFFYQNSDGSFNTTTSPTMNMRTLEDFYEAHRMYGKFIYPHPSRGNVICRFARPLITPKGITEQVVVLSNGVRQHELEGFELQLISQP